MSPRFLRSSLVLIGSLLWAATWARNESGRLQVGPGRELTTLAQAAEVASEGELIEVDAGEYFGDTAVWTQKNLRLVAVGGRVRLNAGGQAAEGKALWVVRAEGLQVRGFDFIGTRVPDRNGAGIRLERGSLLVEDCLFIANENGIMTSNDPTLELEVRDSEFAYNGAGDGLSHHLYAGAIARLTVRGSYFHHANVGHLLKSRAQLNDIRYNRLTDEVGGRASYELNLPNGGLAYVIGNLIQQSASTENPTLVSYGEEGYRWPRNELYLINNTLVDQRRSGGSLLRVAPGNTQVTAANNLLAGLQPLDAAASGNFRNNTVIVSAELVSPGSGDYRLRRHSRLRGTAVQVPPQDGVVLMPEGEYSHPHHWIPLKGPARQPGALQATE
ncbi:hypothetical protein [Pelomonas sp. SE-A7]|uniref:hypothetical protein n=1 Tax=Pelomonas sp. SE-A7 TaxID=3054953 RepID=UPI00259CD79E|nr:hypothetical protein [Pelomonas sp. SE-A7]MDM4764886.1 hypothetical protein [Pelomonas sp. SE-A7]